MAQGVACNMEVAICIKYYTMQNFVQKLFFKKINWLLFFVVACVLFLSIFGCVVVFSASNYVAEVNFDNKFLFLIKQIIGVLLGICAMVFMSFVDYRKLKKFKWWAVVITLVLLVLVFVPFVGIENYGARRWIGVGFMSFQPSEIAKFVLVFFCAVHLSENHENIRSFKTLLPVLGVGGSFCLLVILEPNMSITICLALVLLVMLFIGGLSKKHFAIFASFGAVALPMLIVLEPYRIKRLLAFVNPWASPQGEGFQLIQSLYAIGAGGLFGVGLFESRQKHLFLPFSESDFIFSIIAEELGFVGCLFLLAVYVTLVILLIKIARSAVDRYGSLLVGGIASVIAIQTALNIAVVSGSIPPTGLPLPFISAGSTSLMVFMAAIGVAINVYKNRKSEILTK